VLVSEMLVSERSSRSRASGAIGVLVSELLVPASVRSV
jgi:hypothetical protein